MAWSPPSPEPGTSSWDPLLVEIPGVRSPQNIDSKPCFDAELYDQDLFGILTKNVDNVINKWVSENPEGQAEEAVYGEDPLQEDKNTFEANTTWFLGNPTNKTNIPFTGTPGLLPPYNMDGKTPTDFLFLFLNEDILNLIVDSTNKCGNKLKAAALTSRARFAKWTDMTIAELKVFIGVIIFTGTVKLNRMAEYWSKHYLLRLSPRIFMSRDRFFLILRALNVRDNERPETIFKIKPLIDLFNQSMSTIYYPSRNIVIDESLILWKGRLSFRQYIKGEKHRYGIKLYVLVDMHGIVQKIHLYASFGYQPVGVNHVKKVVLLLLEKYINKGHSLYMDENYASVDLAEELLSKNTFVTGTLQAKRVSNPSLIDEKLRAGESCIVHNRNNIVVTKFQDKNEVLYLSSEHRSDYKTLTGRRLRTVKYKPEVQIKYDKCMQAIDKHDQVLSYYSCEHKTIRWYKNVLIHIVQMCLMNGFLLYRKVNNSNIELHNFRKSILENLLQQPNAAELCRSPSERRIHLPTPFPRRGGRTLRKRCRVCYGCRNKRTLVLYGCADCPDMPGLCVPTCFREYHNY